MRRWIVILALVMISGLSAQAQTATPLPTETSTPTPTPTPEPFVYATLEPASTEVAGQMTRFDYVATAGDVQLSNLLMIQVVSEWVMFLFAVVIMWGRRK